MASITSRFNSVQTDYISGNSWINNPIRIGIPDPNISQYGEVDRQYNDDLLWVNKSPGSDVAPEIVNYNAEGTVINGQVYNINLSYYGEKSATTDDKIITMRNNAPFTLPGPPALVYQLEINASDIATVYDKTSLSMVSAGLITVEDPGANNIYIRGRIVEVSEGQYNIILESLPEEEYVLLPFFVYLQ